MGLHLGELHLLGLHLGGGHLLGLHLGGGHLLGLFFGLVFSLDVLSRSDTFSSSSSSSLHSSPHRVLQSFELFCSSLPFICSPDKASKTSRTRGVRVAFIF